MYHLLTPEVLANPYPLFDQLRTSDPVHWDHFLHAWIVTRYADVVTVLHDFSADRTPTPERLAAMGLGEMGPIAEVMVKQMLFLDPPVHTRIRSLASFAFTPQRVEVLRGHIRQIVEDLLAAVIPSGRMDVITELAEPLPYTVTAEMLGVPVTDAPQLKAWSQDFAEMLGNFQHNPDHIPRVRRSVEEMTRYFHSAIQDVRAHPREGLIHSFLTAEVNGDRFTEDEIVANTIVTMVGGQETTTNLIGNGVLTLLRNPDEMKLLAADSSLISSAVEEMLRYEPPSQHTARLAPDDVELGGKKILKRQAVIAVMAAGNRDPERFPEPNRFDITRKDNRHLSFGWAAHFCFGAALARIEAQIAFEAMVAKLANWTLETQSLSWRTNLGLRGLTTLPISFSTAGRSYSDSTSSSVSERARNSKSGKQSMGEAELAAAKRQLLERYLRGDVVHTSASQDAIKPRQSSSRAPLSLAQEALWREAQEPREIPSSFNESITIHRTGPLDAAILERCMVEIIRRHEAWRTTFDSIDGDPFQIIHPAPSGFPIPFTDLSNFRAGASQLEALRLATADAQEPFDLTNGPLVRARLVKLADQQFQLFMTMHQIVVDGISVYQVFPAELAALYDAFSNGRPSPLVDLPVQQGDFAAWERDRVNSGALESHLTFWRKEFGVMAGMSNSSFWPSQQAAGRARQFCGAIEPFTFTKQLSESLRKLGRESGATLFMVLLAGFAALLHTYTTEESIFVGTLAPAGRKHSEVQSLLGYFLNPIALRTEPTPEMSFFDLITQVRQLLSEALCHDEVPFEMVWPGDTSAHASNHRVLFRNLISLAPTLGQLPGGWDQTPMDVESGASRWDLYLELSDRTSGMLGRAQYNPSLFESATVKGLVSDYEWLLEAAVGNVHIPLSELTTALIGGGGSNNSRRRQIRQLASNASD